MTEEQLKLLGPRLAFGQQMMQPQEAQGRQVGGTYVAASPLEHLSNAIRQMVGAKISGGVMDKQQQLLEQQRQARANYGQAVTTAQAGGQGGTLGEPGGGMARPADPQAAQSLLMAGAGSGDPAIQGMAHFGQTQQHLLNESQKLQNQYGYQQQMVDLRNREMWNGTDMFGNPISRPKHAPGQTPSLLPGATGRGTAPGGGVGAGGAGKAQAPGAGDPTQIYPFGRSGPNQAAIDKYAEKLAVTGEMPAGKWGKASAAVTSAISNRMTELYPDANLSENKAGYVSNMNSMRTMQKTADSIDTFEGTALKNADMMLEKAKGLIDTGSPFFNKPVRGFMNKFAGDPKVAEFNAARQVAVQEIGKILGGAVAGGVVTDSQRHEVEGLISGDMTIPQMEATLQTLKADMSNRKAATAAGLEAIKGRMTAKKAAAQPPVPPPASAATGLRKFTRQNGKLVEVTGAH